MKLAEVLCILCFWQDPDLTAAYAMLTYALLVIEIVLLWGFALCVLCIRLLIPGRLLYSFFGPSEVVEAVINSAMTFQGLISAIVKTLNVDGVTSLNYWDNATLMRHMPLDPEMQNHLLSLGPILLLEAVRCYVLLRIGINKVQASKERTWVQKVMFALLIRSYGKILAWRLRTIHKVNHALTVVNGTQLRRDFKNPSFGVPSPKLVAVFPGLLATSQDFRIAVQRLCKTSNAILEEAELVGGDVMEYTRAESRKRLAGLLKKAEERRAMMETSVGGMRSTGGGRSDKAMVRKWGRKLDEFIQPMDAVLERFRAVLSVAEIDEIAVESSQDG
ncbi:hypothetical protein NX059_011425 [Plenodomus lindquistii]|nr:hypothetical protein NX059_011425 [Plenodomus lindquistii]